MRRRQSRRQPIYRLVRPRTILYAFALVFVGLFMLYQSTHRTYMSLSVLHLRAPMYTLAHDKVRNGYTLRFANKLSEPHRFALVIAGIDKATAKSEEADVAPTAG